MQFSMILRRVVEAILAQSPARAVADLFVLLQSERRGLKAVFGSNRASRLPSTPSYVLTRASPIRSVFAVPPTSTTFARVLGLPHRLGLLVLVPPSFPTTFPAMLSFPATPGAATRDARRVQHGVLHQQPDGPGQEGEQTDTR